MKDITMSENTIEYDYTQFQEVLAEKVAAKLDPKIKVEITEVVKNNGVVLKGMTFSGAGEGISPTIYLEAYFEAYQNGYEMEELADKIIDLFHIGSKRNIFDVQEFLDFEKAKNHIAYKLVNYEKNKELLERIPHKQFLDMAVVYYYLLGEEEGDLENATILIYNNHLEHWNISAEELDKIAKDNTPSLLKEDLRHITDVIQELLREDCNFEDEAYGMYVLSNKSKVFGAATILYSDVLKTFADKIKADLYIIPSSVHEVILIPKREGISWEPLRDMVREVNATQLEEVEILSDNLYYYSREEDAVMEACKAA